MADTFTALLRLVLQETGGNNNVWGGINNASAINLLEEGLAGVFDADVSSADLVLTTANGASDQARNMFLKITGNPGVARNITVPSTQKLYIVSNETSPGFDVTVKTSAGSGIVVPSGNRTVLYVDSVLNDVFDAVGVPAIVADSLALGGFLAALYPRLAANNLFTAGQSVNEIVIASGPTPTPDAALGNVFSFRPTVGFTFAKPVNPLSGQTMNIIIEIAGGSGGTFGVGYVWTTGTIPVIPGVATEKWLISLQYDNVDDVWIGSALENVS